MNPLMSQLENNSVNTSNGIKESIKRMMNMINTAQNPQAVIQKLANENPTIRQIMSLNNGDLKTTFYSMCQEKGVNPDDILNQLR